MSQRRASSRRSLIKTLPDQDLTQLLLLLPRSAAVLPFPVTRWDQSCPFPQALPQTAQRAAGAAPVSPRAPQEEGQHGDSSGERAGTCSATVVTTVGQAATRFPEPQPPREPSQARHTQRPAELVSIPPPRLVPGETGLQVSVSSRGQEGTAAPAALGPPLHQLPLVPPGATPAL